MLTPLILLSIGAIFAGYFFNNLLAGYGSKEFWNGIIYLANEKQSYSSIFTILSKSLVAIGVALAVYYYGFNLQKLEMLKSKFKSIYQFVFNKWRSEERRVGKECER